MGLIVAGPHHLEVGSRTLVMGVVNVTPDSFSGDGLAGDVDGATRRALDMVAAGADIIDIGGESTRPHATPVAVERELERVLPLLTSLTPRTTVPVSVDTRHAAVAEAALEHGAAIINDIWGLRGDPAMASVVAAGGAAVVAMHNRRAAVYADLLEEVRAGLQESIRLALVAGIGAERVILDPGFGFGKTPAHNLEIIRRLADLRTLGCPILIGASRKSTLGALLGGADPGRRLEGSLALAVLACANGADILRVHDVAETVRALRVADAVVRGTPEGILALGTPGPTG